MERLDSYCNSFSEQVSAKILENPIGTLRSEGVKYSASAFLFKLDGC